MLLSAFGEEIEAEVSLLVWWVAKSPISPIHALNVGDGADTGPELECGCELNG